MALSHRPLARPRASALIAGLLATLLVVLAGVLFSASASADVDASASTSASADASADVDDFDYASWTSQYDLSLDEEGRAMARVTETLVADFPEHDQNRGIVRGYPQRYLGAGLEWEIVSVTDAEGRAVPYETETEDGMLLVLTGDDEYVHGRTTYVITSTMRDFMAHGAQSGNDEFYWNLLPLNSSQDIGRFQASIHLSPELAAALTGDVACYRGPSGSKDRCTLSGPVGTEEGQTFSVESGPRAAGDGVTAAIGFVAGAVRQPPARLPDPVADFGPATTALGALAAAGGAWVAFASFVRRRRRHTGIVVAQFDVPDDLPPLAAAPLIPGAPNPIPSQFVHLAVRGALRLEDEPGTNRPAVRLLDRGRSGHPLDARTLDVLFPGDTQTRRIPRTSTKFAKRMAKLVAAGTSEARARGWLTSERSPLAAKFGWAAIALLVATITLTIWSMAKDREMMPLSLIAMILALIVVGITAIVSFSAHTVLTPAGAERHEYLQGVKEFIRVAEADRLRMLQSHRGAERRSDGTVDVVHLYEKLLPYAMLLGEERSWTSVLDTAYSDAGHSPSWMQTAAGITIASRLSGYSTAMNTAATYTAPSSAGGSTGGGFSGGGGGGGFSGGR